MTKLIFKEINDLPKDTNLKSMKLGIPVQALLHQKIMFYFFHDNMHAKNVFLIYLFTHFTFTEYLPSVEHCSRYWFFGDKELRLLHLGDLLLNLLK